MSELLELVSRLEQGGGTLTLEGDRIRYSVPSGDPQARGLLAELRKHRERVRELLRQRAEEQRRRPPALLDAERHFGQPHVKLFPFIGRKVRTPKGPGTLIQVFADRVTVVLDSELKKCGWFAPGEIEPINWET